MWLFYWAEFRMDFQMDLELYEVLEKLNLRLELGFVAFVEKSEKYSINIDFTIDPFDAILNLISL